MEFEQAFNAIADWLEKKNRGCRQTNYRLRDWGVSRQRYWGTPIPMIYCDQCGPVPVPEKDLPVVLPEDVKFDGVGSPIKKMREFYQTSCPECGGKAQRETDTFDTFFESSWYYARYTCADQSESMLDERSDYWLPVDQYIGGIEHAVMHLLYARFFHKLMRDIGIVKKDEPFTNLLTQGMVVAETYSRNINGKEVFYAPSEVDVERDKKGRIISAKLLADGQVVNLAGIEKMSKSKNNGVDPQTLIDKYGADTVRLYSMFTAPPTQSLEWNDDSVEGSFRFLRKVWRLVVDDGHQAILQAAYKDEAFKKFNWDSNPKALKELRTEIHNVLQQVNRDVKKYQFNTVVSAGMKMLNILSGLHGVCGDKKAEDAVFAEGVDILIRILYPIVPHICFALWSLLKSSDAIADAAWPQPDPAALAVEQISMPVMVNGKRRATIDIMVAWNNSQIEEFALSDPNVKKHIQSLTIRKVVIVPSKLVNIVAN